tara:strand:+ start:232 stop:414 length:183 start_codon:yes stop_codon:yes gene_type:complete
MTALFSILGIFSMLFAVGSIDGPTLETSGSNWVGCFIFAIVGIVFMILALINQSKEYNNG